MKKLQRYYFFIFLLAAALLLSACQSQPTSVSGQQSNPPATVQVTALPTPESGKTMMTGRALNKTTGKPYAETTVRLAQIFRQGDQGAYVMDAARSPSSITDANGVFVFPNLSPAEYLIVVGRPEDGNYVIYESNGKPYTYKPEAGKALNVGDIRVDYAP